MNRELTAELIKEFPEILRGVRKPPSESLMCFGFEYSDGWYDLTHKMLTELQEADPECHLLQAKEKWGGLRVYISGNEDAYNIVDKYEKLSYSVCEACGSTDDVKSEGAWVQTLCKACRDA